MIRRYDFIAVEFHAPTSYVFPMHHFLPAPLTGENSQLITNPKKLRGQNGFGVYRWSQGERYEGAWQNDLMQGEGRFFTKHNDVIAGLWHENNF